MLELFYDTESVHRFLRDQGARRLGDEEDELPEHLRGKPGEHWLLSTGWRHAPNIIVHFGATYPDDPPTLCLPASTNEDRELLPHVAETGDICTVVRTSVVNPHRSLEVLQRCLEGAKEILDREWTDAEMAPHINSELAAYWSHRAVETLLYRRADLSAGVSLEVHQWKIGNKLAEAKPITASKFSSPSRLALVVELAADETIPFLRTPGSFLATSRSARESLNSFAINICERTGRLKTFDLFIMVVARWAEDECVLAGFVPQPIRSKGKSAPELVNAILGALSQKGVKPWNAENVGTDRLLRRTMGPHFEAAILDKRIAIVGCGSLGGFVADSLARRGVRRLFLCDTEILKVENLLRHLLPAQYLNYRKADSLRHFLLQRVPDAEIEICCDDIRSQPAIAALATFGPDLIVFATGDTNTDLTMSRLLPFAHRGALVFAWADTDLAAGHLVYQPAGATSILQELHDEQTAHYRYSMADPAVPMLQEAGCQSSYSPYSGLAMAHFAGSAAMRLIPWLVEPPATSQVLRVVPADQWQSLAPFTIVADAAA